MKLIVLNDDGTITQHIIVKENSKNIENKIDFIGSSCKEQNALKIISRYYNNNNTILFDETNKIISTNIQNLDLEIFNNYDFNMMFFTSGSTGNPVGALKTKSNLEEEVNVVSKLIEKYKIQQVIVTVPFIHIYGALFGLLYPLIHDIDIVLKEHFLPHDLLEIINENSLIVTTPLYIKALNKIGNKKDLKSSLFVSSTGPLEQKTTKEFINKFNTNIMQLFGSTETGGIAYKLNNEELWTPLEKVEISVNNKNELKVKSPFVSNTLYENGFKNINGVMQTFDYIEQHNQKFQLVGRSSKIFKLAGKRYSTIQIENILEEVKEINKALVCIHKKDDSRGETLDITLESSKEFSNLEIKNILKSKLSNLKFSIHLHYTDKIFTNSIDKKLAIQ